MKRSCLAFVVPAFLCLSLPSAQAVITLDMPPPGGDGHTALQGGGAISSGLASAWYNPALLSGLRSATGSNIHVTSSHQDVTASNQQEFSGVAVVYPGLGRDLGVSIYRNDFDLGESFPPDGTRNGESVYAMAAGFGVTRFWSLGLAAKYYQSEIGSEDAQGWAFDFGTVYSQAFRPAKRVQSLEVRPSAGMALRNFGPDVWYVDPDLSDPLPRTWSNGLGLELAFADIMHVSLAHDWEKFVHRRAEWSDPWQRTYGYTAAVFGFRYGQGWLRNPGGERSEKHAMREYEFNLQRLMKVWNRVTERDFVSASTSTATRIPGTALHANPRFVIGQREIVSGGREGFEGWYFTLSL